jgi:hypothetical protein
LSASGQNEKFRLFGLMSASAGSSGHNAENAYRRLVPRGDLSRCSNAPGKIACYSIISRGQVAKYGNLRAILIAILRLAPTYCSAHMKALLRLTIFDIAAGDGN